MERDKACLCPGRRWHAQVQTCLRLVQALCRVEKTKTKIVGNIIRTGTFAVSAIWLSVGFGLAILQVGSCWKGENYEILHLKFAIEMFTE